MFKGSKTDPEEEGTSTKNTLGGLHNLNRMRKPLGRKGESLNRMRKEIGEFPI